jgi:hypothetical protein
MLEALAWCRSVQISLDASFLRADSLKFGGYETPSCPHGGYGQKRNARVLSITQYGS